MPAVFFFALFIAFLPGTVSISVKLPQLSISKGMLAGKEEVS